jgi:hypothetical protein
MVDVLTDNEVASIENEGWNDGDRVELNGQLYEIIGHSSNRAIVEYYVDVIM